MTATRMGCDCSAVEGLPLKLLIVSIVASLSVVPASDALEALRDRSFADRCGVQLGRMVCTAQVVSTEGPGASRVLELDFRSEGALSMELLSIGGARECAYMSSVVMELSSGARLICSADEPFAWMASADRTTLSITSERFGLLMTAERADGCTLIRCEVV